MTPDFLLEAPVEEAAESTTESPSEARLGGSSEIAAQQGEVSVHLLHETPVEQIVELLREEPSENSAQQRIELFIETPVEEPAESPVEEPAERTLHLWDGQPPWETAAGGVRITREAPAEQAFVAVIGLGHTGLPSAIALRRAGFRVVGIDTSSSRLNDIRSGRANTLGVRTEDLREHLHDDGFVLSDELEMVRAASSVLICVPAILDAQRHPSLEALKRTCETVVRHAHAGQTIVLTSTSYVGCTQELLVEPLAKRGLRAGDDVFVAFSPERSEPDAAEHEHSRVPRVLGAVTETCYVHASNLIRHVAPSLRRVSSPQAAEMAKLYESTVRAVNVALAFELADACRVAQLDRAEVAAAAASNPSTFTAHEPSAGVGDRSVGIEPHYLLQPLRERGRPALLAEEAMRTIAARPRRIAMRAHELLQRSGQRPRDVRVLVVGAAYKPGVADCSGAPAVEIISWLAAEGVPVEYHDPLVPALRIDDDELHSIDPDPRRDASGFGPEDYDLAIVVTIHPGYDYGWLRRCPQVLDCTYSQPTDRRCLLP
jgi:nucleotide sugar dehydrogenase